MARASIIKPSTWAVEQPKIEANFTELYAGTPKVEVVVPTARQFSLANLSKTIVTNEGQTVSANVENTTVALVAGLEWDVIITETLNSGIYWQITVPVGVSILYNGTMGTSGGRVRFTTATMGDVAHFRTVTINGAVIVVCESSATTISVT